MLTQASTSPFLPCALPVHSLPPVFLVRFSPFVCLPGAGRGLLLTGASSPLQVHLSSVYETPSLLSLPDRPSTNVVTHLCFVIQHISSNEFFFVPCFAAYLSLAPFLLQKLLCVILFFQPHLLWPLLPSGLHCLLQPTTAPIN